MDKKAYAKQLLTHYFRMCAKESGFHWNFDNVSEIESIVDSIVDAAKEEILEELSKEK